MEAALRDEEQFEAQVNGVFTVELTPFPGHLIWVLSHGKKTRMVVPVGIRRSSGEKLSSCIGRVNRGSKRFVAVPSAGPATESDRLEVELWGGFTGEADARLMPNDLAWGGMRRHPLATIRKYAHIE